VHDTAVKLLLDPWPGKIREQATSTSIGRTGRGKESESGLWSKKFFKLRYITLLKHYSDCTL